jgi:hypothetical protein
MPGRMVGHIRFSTEIKLSLLDTLAPQRGPDKRRYGPMFLAKTSFYLAAFFGAIFVFTSFVLFDGDRELKVIPATRVESEIFDPVQQYLNVEVNCWSEFENEDFNVEYLDRGSWRVDAFYNLVRYYWRIDDKTLEVTRDPWNRSTNPTIRC